MLVMQAKYTFTVTYTDSKVVLRPLKRRDIVACGNAYGEIRRRVARLRIAGVSTSEDEPEIGDDISRKDVIGVHSVCKGVYAFQSSRLDASKELRG